MRWSYTLSPHDRGALIEDVWPTIFFGAERVEEMRRKISELRWAQETFELMKREAEEMLREPPQLPVERIGWRHDFYSPLSGEHLLYDPKSPDAFLDPLTGELISGEPHHRAWALLTHERTYRIMRSLGFLYALTGDERYAEWVAQGMRGAVEMFSHRELREGNNTEALYFQPLYDAQVLMLLAEAYELTCKNAAYSKADHEAIRRDIFEDGVSYQFRFLEKAGVHNMTCYVSAAISVVGRLLGRTEWVKIGLHQPKTGLKALLEGGVPADENRGFDGFWFEGTTFYHFYSLCPLITLYELKDERNSDLTDRFKAMFDAPVQLADGDLRLPPLGDLGAPKVLSLIAYRHLYEYAAGQIDFDRFAPVLASIYAATGEPRGGLTALAFGPDELSSPGGIPAEPTLLKRSGIGIFRKDGFYLLFKSGAHGGGHDHLDKLSISLHGMGEVISPDPGTAGYSLREACAFWRGTFAHNTIMVDERNQGRVRNASLEWHPDADPPYVRGIIRDAYPGVKLERTLLFDPPYVVIADRCESEDEHRYGWVFHAYGSMDATISQAVDPLDMPPLPEEGTLSFFTARRSTAALGLLEANWRVSERVWLRLLVRSDGVYEATMGRTPGNPLTEDRGTILLRAPGKTRRFFAVLELHRGIPSVKGISIEKDGRIRLITTRGERMYPLSS
jgi:hypothetical protein